MSIFNSFDDTYLAKKVVYIYAPEFKFTKKSKITGFGENNTDARIISKRKNTYIRIGEIPMELCSLIKTVHYQGAHRPIEYKSEVSNDREGIFIYGVIMDDFQEGDEV